MDKSVNIAILGNCTTDFLTQALKNECEKHSISAHVYNCPYNQYNQEILNKESEFYRSKPELSILFLEGKLLFPEWYEFNSLVEGSKNKISLIDSVFDSLTLILENIHSNNNTNIIINNFKMPYYSPLGILDGNYFPGLKDMVAMLNLKLDEWSADKDYIYIFDYSGLSAQFGNAKAEDRKMYYIAKNTMSFQFMNVLAREYMRYILPLKFMSKKCLVLDLDNTLWGGLAGEDGMSGISLDISGKGKSFYDFQKEIINLYNKGIILAVNSKNNVEDAMSIINNHPHMLLREHHFSSLKINWNDKFSNIKEISKDLNISTDSMVFFDDSPVERELIKSMLPEVKVVEVPADTSRYADTLKNIVEFEFLKITDEDIKRNLMYKGNQRRIELRQQFKNIEDYLASLKIKVVIEYANKFSIPRIAQLTQKTNQFNMTTKRYSQTDIENMVKSENYFVLSCQVLDKFGDNGISGVCIIKMENTCAYFDTFLLSCRVLGRNVEYAYIHKIISLLRGKSIDHIYALFIRTEKNKANKKFYAQAGFTKSLSDEKEIIYSLESINELKSIKYIEMIMNEGE